MAPTLKFIWKWGVVLAGSGIVLIMVFLTASRYTLYTANVDQGDHTDYLHSLALLPDRIVPTLFRADRFRVELYLGLYFLRESKNTWNPMDAYSNLESAQAHLKAAVSIVPHDILAIKGLTVVTDRLEKRFAQLFPENPNPHTPLPLFQKILKRDPNGLHTHYMVARYFSRKGFDRELETVVEQIAFIAPDKAVTRRFASEPFYSKALQPGIVRGLNRALHGRWKRSALFALSTLAAGEEDFFQAVTFYRQGMRNKTYKNRAGNYLRMGELLFLNHQEKEAFASFSRGMALTRNSQKSVNRIYRFFKVRNQDETFLAFAGKTWTDTSMPIPVALCIARARMNLGYYELARAGLLTLIFNKKEDDRVYSLLAAVSEVEKNWGQMELDIQRATVLDPENCRYYHSFAKALARQGKTVQAQIQKRKAAECTSKKQTL